MFCRVLHAGPPPIDITLTCTVAPTFSPDFQAFHLSRTPPFDALAGALAQLTQLTALRWLPRIRDSRATVPTTLRSLRCLQLHTLDPNSVMAIVQLTALTQLRINLPLFEAAVQHLAALRNLAELSCGALILGEGAAAGLAVAPLAAVTLLEASGGVRGAGGLRRCLRWFPSLVTAYFPRTSDEDLAALAIGARQLRSLWLRQSDFSAEGLAQLAGLSALTELHIAYPDQLSDDAVINLIVNRGGLRQLARFQLGGSRQLGSFAMAIIGTHLTRLREAYFWCSQDINVDGLSTLIATTPSLRRLVLSRLAYTDATIDICRTRAQMLGRRVELMVVAGPQTEWDGPRSIDDPFLGD